MRDWRLRPTNSAGGIWSTTTRGATDSTGGGRGGEVYSLGSAAGRPMINAVGSPRVVINGTALDFLAESFMAGDPHNGGGFAIVNGLQYDQAGGLTPQETP